VIGVDPTRATTALSAPAPPPLEELVPEPPQDGSASASAPSSKQENLGIYENMRGTLTREFGSVGHCF
jgi:hypothetical protein